MIQVKRPVDVPERLLMDDRQAGQIHLVEKKEQTVEIAPSVFLSYGAQAAGNLAVRVDDLVKSGQFQQAAQHVRGADVFAAQNRIQRFIVPPKSGVRNRFKQRIQTRHRV
jgi:hypothetical protein